jgi:hypothetical protein
VGRGGERAVYLVLALLGFTGRRGFDSLVVESPIMRVLTISLAVLVASALADAASAVHTFRVWGTESATQKSTSGEKLSMYVVWSNGYFSGRGAQAFPLRSCIEDNIPYDQAIAMIGRYYDDHPEKWSNDLSD